MRYSAVATARSALSTIIKVDGVKVGEHPLVPRFMTGLFNQKPALPRYTNTNVTPEWYSTTSKRCQPLIICHWNSSPWSLLYLWLSCPHREFRPFSPCHWREWELYLESIFSHLFYFETTSAKGDQNRHLLPITFHSYTLDKRLCVVELLTA